MSEAPKSLVTASVTGPVGRQGVLSQAPEPQRYWMLVWIRR